MTEYKTIKFKTATCSIYEVDMVNKRIRRLHGVNNPTDRQGEDGIWKQFEEITAIEPNKSVVIVWSRNLTGDVPVMKTTVTSAVDKILNSDNMN